MILASSPFDELKGQPKDSVKYPSSAPNDINKIWLERVFRKHYFNYSSTIELDEYMSQREFGFRLFDGHVRRHLNFNNKNELIASIIKYSPSDVFCSSSRYQNPSASIDQKSWIGSDLIFDIDGKDLHLECAKIHNLTYCKNCKLITSEVYSNCIGCKSNLIQIIEIPCHKCIKNLKLEVKKLIEILCDDFGIDNNSISIYFSGNNGFHIHVNDNKFFTSNSIKRSALTQYLLGRGYLTDNLGFRLDSSNKITILSNKILYNVGWRARLMKQFHLQLKNHRIDDKFIKKINYIKETSEFDLLNIINTQIEKLSVKIDPNVTIDTHRIFRLAGTINSKSGLIKFHCTDLESFSPFDDACINEDSVVEINSKMEMKLFLKGTSYKVKLGINSIPEFVAVYIISKGIGDICIQK